MRTYCSKLENRLSGAGMKIALAYSVCSLVSLIVPFTTESVICNEADSKHHITPSSRGGGDEDSNTCKIPEGFHQSYHQVFQNLTPQEAVKFVQEFNRLAEKYSKLDGRDLYDLRKAIKSGPLPDNNWEPDQ